MKKRLNKKPLNLIAYDLETTRIDAGTPDVLYLTAHGRDLRISTAIRGPDRKRHLCNVLESLFLIPDNAGACFVAWNGNHFDAYLVMEALLQSDDWHMIPYLTQSNQLRGVRVRSKEKRHERKYLSFQFLDGMAMTGVQAKLDKFVRTFAPEFPKLDLDLDEITFDPKNRQHVAYAERDSEALYHAMVAANRKVFELTGEELRPTIGNTAIRYFMGKLPIDPDHLRRAPKAIETVLHGSVKRGGYVWAARQYRGPAWKYDINQAYAAAMRDCALPCGSVATVLDYESDLPGIYLCDFARDTDSDVPFYYKPFEGIGTFTVGAPGRAWLTSIEVQHLLADGWSVEFVHGYRWSDSFDMSEMVGELERLRASDADGPSGPLGTMCKSLGNHAYGKTLSMLSDEELLIARECPGDLNDKGHMKWSPKELHNQELRYVFVKQGALIPRLYQRPQIGCFITAHVRMVVRSAALAMADAFLYADTDCVIFSREAHHLDVHPTRYGAWKLEAANRLFVVICKKVYANEYGEYKAKGLKLRDLTPEIERLRKAKDRAAKKAAAPGATSRDQARVEEIEAELRLEILHVYDDWKDKGIVPRQMQLQRQNVVKFLGGAKMYADLSEFGRSGTDVKTLVKTGTVDLINGRFYPKRR